MRKVCISMILCIVVCLCGCGRVSPSQGEKVIQDNTSVTTNIPFSVRQSISVAIKKDTINAKYGKPKKIQDLKDGNSYEIRNMEDGSSLYVIYSSDRVYDIWRLKKFFSKEDFTKIKIGESSCDDIKEIDPYYSLWIESEEKAISEHRMRNNEIAIIQYVKKDSKWIVNDINYGTDPSNFSTTILDEDLSNIS